MYRTAMITGSHKVETLVSSMIKARLDYWSSEQKRPTSKLTYKRAKRSDISVPLLKQTNEADWTAFTCLNSLRDVEPNVKLILDDYRMDGELQQEDSE